MAAEAMRAWNHIVATLEEAIEAVIQEMPTG